MGTNQKTCTCKCFNILWLYTHATAAKKLAAVSLTKLSSDDDSGVKHGLEVKASLSITPNASLVVMRYMKICEKTKVKQKFGIHIINENIFQEIMVNQVFSNKLGKNFHFDFEKLKYLTSWCYIKCACIYSHCLISWGI